MSNYKHLLHSPVILVEMQEDGLFSHLGEARLEDSLEVLTQEIAADLFKACIGPSVLNENQMVFDITLCNLILDRLEQIYRPRTQKTAGNPHVGYIYVIERPQPMRLPEHGDKHIIWVGVSETPWLAFQRALSGLGSSKLVQILKGLKKWSLDNGYYNFVWRKEEIAEAYNEGREQPIHGLDKNFLWLPWRIIDDNQTKQITMNYYVQKYREEGHPLKNGEPGRKKNWVRTQVEPRIDEDF